MSVALNDEPAGLSAETLAELRSIAARYPEPRSGLLPMLHLVQSVSGPDHSRGHRGLRRDPRHLGRRGQRRRDVLHDVQAQAGR